MRTSLVAYLQLTVAMFLVCLTAAGNASEEDEWLRAIGAAPAPAKKKEATRSPAMVAAVPAQETVELGNPSGKGLLRNEDLAWVGEQSPSKLRAFAEKHLRDGSYDTAIKMLERSLELDSRDLRTRISYAEALEAKYLSSPVRDPRIFNLSVKQWLYVFKHSEFLEDSSFAANHLKKLTGKKPTPLTRTQSYLTRVLLPEDEPVELGAVRGNEPQQVH